MVKAKEPDVTKAKRRAGQMVGYLRMIALAQKELRQLDGITVEKRFTDKASGKDMHRPQLQLLLEYVRDGDTVVCHAMDRLARNLDNLRKIVLGLTELGVHVRFETFPHPGSSKGASPLADSRRVEDQACYRVWNQPADAL